MTANRFVILDRDGTINAECKYLSQPEQVELLPGAASGLRQMRALGLGLILITNQSGVDRGYFDYPRLESIHQRLQDLLEAEGVALDAIYVCPHTPEDDCNCRKPKTGLLEQAGHDYGFDPASCFVIGDKSVDIELGQRVGATTFLVRTGYGAELEREGTVRPDYIVDELEQAVQVIERLLEENHE
jgi:D-glycero-D-manno-heptose 1,7-bisphosphate phosphatase